MSIFLAVNWNHSHNKWMCSVCWIFCHLPRRIISAFYQNKGLFPSSMQKYISLICGLRTSENLAWWSRSKPNNKRCVFLALKSCHELPFPIHYPSTSGLREQSFLSSFFKYSSTAGPQKQQIQLRLWQVLFNSQKSDDRWWYKLAKKRLPCP